MTSFIGRIQTQGKITIPHETRTALGLKYGTMLELKIIKIYKKEKKKERD